MRSMRYFASLDAHLSILTVLPPIPEPNHSRFLPLPLYTPLALNPPRLKQLPRDGNFLNYMPPLPPPLKAARAANV